MNRGVSRRNKKCCRGSGKGTLGEERRGKKFRFQLRGGEIFSRYILYLNSNNKCLRNCYFRFFRCWFFFGFFFRRATVTFTRHAAFNIRLFFKTCLHTWERDGDLLSRAPCSLGRERRAHDEAGKIDAGFVCGDLRRLRAHITLSHARPKPSMISTQRLRIYLHTVSSLWWWSQDSRKILRSVRCAWSSGRRCIWQPRESRGHGVRLMEHRIQSTRSLGWLSTTLTAKHFTKYNTPSYDRICASTDFRSIDSNENANEPHAWPASRQVASWRQPAASFLDSGRVEALGNRKRKTKVGLGDWSSPTGNRTPVGGGISQLTVMKIRNDNHYTTGESPWFQTRWHFRNWNEHFICIWSLLDILHLSLLFQLAKG